MVASRIKNWVKKGAVDNIEVVAGPGRRGSVYLSKILVPGRRSGRQEDGQQEQEPSVFTI